MPYTKTSWVANVTPVTAASMNNIEAGIAARDEIGYTEAQGPIPLTATTAPAAGAILAIGPLTYLAQPVMIEFQVPMMYTATNEAAIFNLWDGSTDLGRIAQVLAPSTAAMQTTVTGGRRLAPSAGSHTYSIKAWCTIGAGNSVVGGASPTLPFYLRISYA